MPRKREQEIVLFGAAVTKYRTRKKLNKLKLAELCGIDEKTVRRIEKGEIAPGFEIILALADAFGIPPSKLFREVEEI